MDLFDKVSRFPIKPLRRITPTIVSGPTLENMPDMLLTLKDDFGVKTIVDFRDYTIPTWTEECTNFRLSYFKLGLDNTILKLPKKIDNSFIINLNKFFGIMNRGNAYIGCQYGRDRTNAALLFNFFLNPKRDNFSAPQILSGTFETPSRKADTVHKSLNRTITRIWHMVKKMTPEQRAELGLSGTLEEIYKTVFKPQINKVIKENSANLRLVV